MTSREPRVLCLVLAGGKGSRLGPLTEGRAKPSLPIGGHYRLIDLSLSNATHSRLSDVWVLQQYEPHLLNEHLAGGRPWDLDRTRGGFRILPPYEGSGKDGFAQGNADALVRNWEVITALDPDALVVCSADHLVRVDHRPAVAAHLDSGADATVVSTLLPRGTDVSRYLVVDADGDRVRGVDYKPSSPTGRRVGTEVFVYDVKRLGEHLRALLDEDGDLGDYGERLLPRLVEHGAVTHVEHEGYWRDLGTPTAYLDGNLDLLGERPKVRLDDPEWPVLTSMPVRAPARVTRTAELDEALLSPGAQVGGTVVRSVIGPGAVVEPGAEVRHSVVMAGAVVRRGAVVARAVLGEGVSVGSGARVGAPQAVRPVLVGTDRRIPRDADVPAGSELDPVARKQLRPH